MTSFEKIQLPVSLIADLYKQSLVVIEGEESLLKQAGTIASTPAAPQTKEEQVTPKLALEASIEQTIAQPAKPVINYKGGFRKKISVVIADAQHTDINPADLEFLQKMMTACKLTLDDLAIINTVSNQPTAQQLWEVMPAAVVLLFGVQTNDVGIPFYRPNFQIQHWSNAQFMAAPPLAQFRGADTPEIKGLKRELWEALQKIFLGK